MGNRNPEAQSKHDQKVKEIADAYKSESYEVYADIKGYGQPHKRNGYIPDVVAKKNGKEIIIEVETSDSIKTDKEQQNAFRRYANARSNVTFKIEMAD